VVKREAQLSRDSKRLRSLGLRLSRSFKITNFGTKRNPVYHFLLANNNNVPPVSYTFQVTVQYSSHFLFQRRGISL